jgi:hypothetical protein
MGGSCPGFSGLFRNDSDAACVPPLLAPLLNLLIVKCIPQQRASLTLVRTADRHLAIRRFRRAEDGVLRSIASLFLALAVRLLWWDVFRCFWS